MLQNATMIKSENLLNYIEVFGVGTTCCFANQFLMAHLR